MMCHDDVARGVTVARVSRTMCLLWRERCKLGGSIACAAPGVDANGPLGAAAAAAACLFACISYLWTTLDDGDGTLAGVSRHVSRVTHHVSRVTCVTTASRGPVCRSVHGRCWCRLNRCRLLSKSCNENFGCHPACNHLLLSQSLCLNTSAGRVPTAASTHHHDLVASTAALHKDGPTRARRASRRISAP